MSNAILALILVELSTIIGIVLFICVAPSIKSKAQKRLCNIAILICAVFSISFYICALLFKHTYKTEINEYPIEKLTTNKVYFNSDNERLHNVTVERGNVEHINTMIVRTEYYTIQWIFKIHVKSHTYYVELSDDVYNKFRNKAFYLDEESEW